MGRSLPPQRDLAPSAFVRQCAEQIVRAAGDKPVLDLACGSGRHGWYLESFGCDVVFVDCDLAPLHDRARCKSFAIDLARDPWPFGPSSLGGIVSVHFLLPELFPHFAAALTPGGCLLVETVPGCGHNYRELPKAGCLRQKLAEDFTFQMYQERTVGPPDTGAVTVRLLAQRRSL